MIWIIFLARFRRHVMHMRKCIVRQAAMITAAPKGRNCTNPRCLGAYDYEHIAFYARKRFVEGVDTISLLQQAVTQREKEEIALVCMLDIEDGVIKRLDLNCRHAETCEVTDCRDRLRQLITRDLKTVH